MLAAQLDKVTVSNGIFLALDTVQHLSSVETVLPASGEIYKNIARYVGESPVVDFVSGVLARELSEKYEFSSASERVPLRSLPDYSNLSEISERLIGQFESLPWNYAVTVALPAELDFYSIESNRAVVSENVSIIRGGDLADQIPFSVKNPGHPPANSLLALLDSVVPSWNEQRWYLQISVEGFIGKYATTEPLLGAISNLRAFFGLGIALRLFKTSYAYQPYPRAEKIYVHRRVGSSWSFEEGHELDLMRSNVINGLRFDQLDGALDKVKIRQKWISEQLSAISVVFQSGDRATNVVLGAQWLFDSHCGSDEMLQFVQAAIVIEILLGDKVSSDQIGLGELLSNRCAYLIAYSHTQRGEILQDFRKIYAVRSKIVHRGKSRLTTDERVWGCSR